MKYSFCITSIGTTEDLELIKKLLPPNTDIEKALRMGEAQITQPGGKVVCRISIRAFKERESSTTSTSC
jgi:hypothetical protein